VLAPRARAFFSLGSQRLHRIETKRPPHRHGTRGETDREHDGVRANQQRYLSRRSNALERSEAAADHDPCADLQERARKNGGEQPPAMRAERDLLGDDTGFDLLVEIGNLLRGALDRFRDAIRRLTEEELAKIRELQK
jgi:hypothetical protein